MRGRTLAVAASAVVLAAAGLTMPLVGQAAAASALKNDFNGDGYRDLAIGTPGANAVTVTYGSASGVSPARSVTVTQNTSGVPGVTEDGDEFGENVHSGDVNGDGYADLIIGAPGEKVSGKPDGSVTFVWGGASGFKTGGAVLNAPSDTDQRFGEDTAFVDLDGDGAPNLTVISANRWWWYGDGGIPKTAIAPEVDFLPAGVRLEGMQAAHFTSKDGYTYVVHGEKSDGFPYVGYVKGGAGDIGYHSGVVAEDGDRGATRDAAAAGDVNGDGYTDLVTGNNYDQSVTVHYGGAGDFGATATYTQDSTGVPGTTEAGDEFGGAVAAGDLDGDGFSDVAVGAPGERVGTVTAAGAVTVLKGGKGGLSAGHGYHQDTSGVPGAGEPEDHFGSSLAFKDINSNGRADLAIGAAGEDIGKVPTATKDAGAVWVLRGSSPYLTTSYATSFNGFDFGIGGAGRAFGSFLN